MKNILHRFHKHFYRPNGQATAAPAVDISTEIEAVRRAEADRDLDPGKRIHGFRYRGLELRLDRDVTGMYRVTVNEGRERRYSFTIVCEQGDYEALHAGYDEITHFLDGDRRVVNMPNHARLKGHYYGH
ncbi:MAG: hypothetical protein ACE5G0_08205 [Rhodothermales bacterium]